MAGDDRRTGAKARKIYRGSRLAGVFVDGKPLRHIAVHSPTGFDWGYGGSGPADLALSILADHFGETAEQVRDGWSKAYRWHQEFKWAFVVHFGEEWAIDTETIEAWLERAKGAEAVAGLTRGVCRECGCTDEFACEADEDGEPCWWVDTEHTLCSRCAAAER